MYVYVHSDLNESGCMYEAQFLCMFMKLMYVEYGMCMSDCFDCACMYVCVCMYMYTLAGTRVAAG